MGRGSSDRRESGCAPEDMVARSKELGAWPLTLSIRAFNRYDFTAFPGAAANHAVANAKELADLLTEMASRVPADAPFPLLVRLQVVPAGHDAPLLSHECVAESADELRAVLHDASLRAGERFV